MDFGNCAYIFKKKNTFTVNLKKNLIFAYVFKKYVFV